jgi:hypothetical protein
MPTQCFFMEPWIGRCTEERAAGLCCEKHAKEKCQVCGEQALTRCQASIGVMCGIPLCHKCGTGEMCLYHASSGPLAIIRGLLGGGPVPSVFATIDILERKRLEMVGTIDRLKKHDWSKCRVDIPIQAQVDAQRQDSGD